VSVDAISSTQLLVTWRSPERELWNGEILGYAIGFRKTDDAGDQAYNYSRMGSSGSESNVHEFRLTGLDKYTSYSVIILAFNTKGDGPPTKVIKAQTLEDTPSAPPQKITCSAMAWHNIQLNWLPPPAKHMHGDIQGYKVSYEPTNILNDYTNRETKVTSSLNTVIHNLQPFTNYTVQIQAFTKAGEGVASTSLICRTEESAPDAPEKIKTIVTGENSVVISWLPPRRPNGILTLYTIFTRILSKGQEVKVDKQTVTAHNHHYEAKNLNPRETYEAWVTASTKLGSGKVNLLMNFTFNTFSFSEIRSFNTCCKTLSFVTSPCSNHKFWSDCVRCVAC
jgi:Down syndrome cell adhesion molecule